MTMDYPKVEPNNDWKTKLFDHQLTAIHLLEQREKTKKIIDDNIEIETNMGIFADPTDMVKP